MDVSKYQTTQQVQAVTDDAAQAFVIVAATTGLQAVSPTYTSHRATAGAKFLGAYHWGCPYNDSATTANHSDPVGEAQHFVQVAALEPGQLAFLDLEQSDASDWPTRVAYALGWLDEVKRLTGATPVIYLNWSWIKGLRGAATDDQWARLTAYPLWLAEPTGVPGQHSTVTSKDGTNPDSWPIVLQQYLVDTLDHDWTPDFAALKALGKK